jgi:transposase
MKLPPNAEIITHDNPDQIKVDQDFLLLEMAKILEQKDEALEQKDDIIDKKSEVIAQLKKCIVFLQEMVNLAKARQFGQSSEKHPGQGELFDEAELCSSETSDIIEEHLPEDDNPEPKQKKRSGRKGLSKDLPRIQQLHLLSDEDKKGAIDTFFTKVKEELDIVPAKAQVIEHMQEKAVFPDKKETDKTSIKAAELPKHPLGKCIATTNLLAHIIISKYADGLPLYRLENILKRYGGEITRTSMANWVIRLQKQLQPLINLLRDHQLSYDYLNIDETRIKVLKEPGYSPSSHKWMWVTRGGPPDKPVILFDYRVTRAKTVPEDLLEGFAGYLQADGYAAYDAVATKLDLKLLACWDHARRKFIEAEKAAGKTKKGQGPKIVPKYKVALSYIGKLYAIEKKIKDETPQLKKLERQKHSLPLLKDFKAWLDKNIAKVPKGTKTHTAIQYTLNQWAKLIRYCDDGRLNISNVLAENAIRPFVIGRKGWLFADTPQGAHASATHYSLIETAKANNVEPFEYYSWMLARLPYAETVEDFEKLLPWNFKKSDSDQ